MSLTSSMFTCQICADDYVSKSIKTCSYCSEQACNNCIKTYTMNLQNTQKNCMFCNKKFNRIDLIKLFGSTFIDSTDYKNHIKDLLFKEERNHIPKSLPIIEKQNDIKKYNQLIKNLKQEINNDIDNQVYDKYSLEFCIKSGKIHAYNLYLYNIKNNKKKEKIIYKYPCANNKCNGFVNNIWNCQLCDLTTCKNCFTIAEENHECKQDDIDTANIIKNNSKPCPNCNISIIKTDGCDQMWCVSCHTTFDWKTLQIKKSGIIHNPEYFRYLRENGIAIPRYENDNPCNNDYNHSFNLLSVFNRRYKNTIKEIEKAREFNHHSYVTEYITYNLNRTPKFKLNDKSIEKANNYADRKEKECVAILSKPNITTKIDSINIDILYEYYRIINHIRDTVLNGANNTINSYEQWKDKERIRFLTNQINEERYKINLLKHFKTIEYLTHFVDFQSTIIEISKDLLINICNNLEKDVDKAVENDTEKIDIFKKYNIYQTEEVINKICSDWDTINHSYKLSKKLEIPKFTLSRK